MLSTDEFGLSCNRVYTLFCEKHNKIPFNNWFSKKTLRAIVSFLDWSDTGGYAPAHL